MSNSKFRSIIKWFPKNILRSMGILLILFLVVLPFFITNRFYISLVNEILIFGLAVMGMDIMVGYTGLVPFGHAAYFGVGAYATSLFLVYTSGSSLWLAFLVATGSSAIIATGVGWLMVRLGGISFALTSMAFGQMFFTIIWKAREITKGDDGLLLQSRPELTIGGWSLGSTANPVLIYFFTLIIIFACFILARRVMHSPFGAVLQAIRENEVRASFIGFNVRKYKLLSFVFASTLTSVAGFLFVLLRGHVAPFLLHWSTSGEMLIMALLGGIGTLWGSFVGAFFLIFAKDYISTMTEHWMLPLGILLILTIFFAPRGLAGVVHDISTRGKEA